MLKIAAPLAAALLLTGCSRPPLAEPSLQAVQDAEITDSLGFDWFFGDTGAAVSLSYAVPETDALKLSLSCAKGSGRVTLKIPAAASAPRRIRLKSGEATIALTATVEPDPTTDSQVFLVADLNAQAAVLRTLRRTGRIEVATDGSFAFLAAQRDSPRRMAAFFEGCGGGLRPPL
jgi:hypothetical protein